MSSGATRRSKEVKCRDRISRKVPAVNAGEHVDAAVVDARPGVAILGEFSDTVAKNLREELLPAVVGLAVGVGLLRGVSSDGGSPGGSLFS